MASAPSIRAGQAAKATLGLRELVLDGELAPGERVAEVVVAERLGVSRTPLRHALSTLAHEGLLEPIGSGGFVVRAFTRRDIEQAIELRGVLEGTAARLAAERRPQRSELDALRAASSELDLVVADLTDGSIERYAELNERFHAEWVGLALSPTLARVIDNVAMLPFASPSAFVTSQIALPRGREILVFAQLEHRRLIEAIEAGQGVRAEAIGREHARNALASLDQVLEDREALAQLRGAGLLSVSPPAG